MQWSKAKLLVGLGKHSGGNVAFVREMAYSGVQCVCMCENCAGSLFSDSHLLVQHWACDIYSVVACSALLWVYNVGEWWVWRESV